MDGNEILAAAKKEPSRRASYRRNDYEYLIPAVKCLRNEKGFSWSEIRDWMRLKYNISRSVGWWNMKFGTNYGIDSQV